MQQVIVQQEESEGKWKSAPLQQLILQCTANNNESALRVINDERTMQSVTAVDLEGELVPLGHACGAMLPAGQ